MFKSLLIAALALFIPLSITHAEQAETHAHHAQTKPVVAVFYASWCGSCKILEPKMMQALSEIEHKDALEIVKFDLSNPTTKDASKQLAKDHHLSDLYNQHAPKTGFAILVDAKAHDDHVTIMKNDSVEDIKAKLNHFINTHS